ncbi:MAG: RNA polymerase factor sigma-32 [Hyphomicrobiales bacterium]|nr:RNA polymerase factor sigma-32 [Hyphomicrobiales bacterium]
MNRLEGVSQSFVKAAMRAPYLSRDDERELAQKWSEGRDETALHRLTQAHMRLVISMAVKFRHYGLPIPDLMQEGHVGLLEAAARFEPSREVRFSTYAIWWIRASMQDYILRNWSIVRGGTSSGQKALFFNLRRLRAKISRNGPDADQSSTFAEVAMALGVSVHDVEMMNARLSSPDSSLNAPVSGEDEGSATERGNFLVDPQPLPDEVAESQIDGERRSKLLRQALTKLNPRELRIVRARRLADEVETLESLGQELGISKERVRQIEGRALEKLQEIMVAGGRLLPA